MKKPFNLLHYQKLLKLEKDGQISFLNLELLNYTSSIE